MMNYLGFLQLIFYISNYIKKKKNTHTTDLSLQDIQCLLSRMFILAYKDGAFD